MSTTVAGTVLSDRNIDVHDDGPSDSDRSDVTRSLDGSSVALAASDHARTSRGVLAELVPIRTASGRKATDASRERSSQRVLAVGPVGLVVLAVARSDRWP